LNFETHLPYVIIEDLESKCGGLSLSYIASIEKLNKIIQLPRERAEETGFWNRWDNKEIWGSAGQYASFIHEMCMLNLAKIVEDIKVDIKKKLHIRFHPWDEELDVIYLKYLKSCWAISNVIKHNQSNLRKGTSKYADYLINEWEAIEGYDFESFILSRHEMFEFIEYIPKVYLAICDFIYQKTGAKSHFFTTDWLDMADRFYHLLLPDIFEIDIPKFKE